MELPTMTMMTKTKSNPGKKTNALLAAGTFALAALAAPGGASAALAWSYDWAGADALVGAVNTRPLSNATDEARFTAESVVRFIDNDRDSLITPGDTFVDYVLLRFNAFSLGGVDNGEAAAGYGGATGGREITLAAVFTGVQTGADSYTVDPGGRVNLIYDAGPGYTPADFANLATFADTNGGAGRVVESGTVVAPSGGLNNSPALPNGSIDVSVLFDNAIVAGGFEIDPLGGRLPGLPLVLFAADNVACADSGGTAVCTSTADDILTFFGAPQLGANQFQFHTRSDRSMTLVSDAAFAVPEPGSLELLGAGLLGLYAARRGRGRGRNAAVPAVSCGSGSRTKS